VEIDAANKPELMMALFTCSSSQHHYAKRVSARTTTVDKTGGFAEHTGAEM